MARDATNCPGALHLGAEAVLRAAGVGGVGRLEVEVAAPGRPRRPRPRRRGPGGAGWPWSPSVVGVGTARRSWSLPRSRGPSVAQSRSSRARVVGRPGALHRRVQPAVARSKGDGPAVRAAGPEHGLQRGELAAGAAPSPAARSPPASPRRGRPRAPPARTSVRRAVEVVARAGAYVHPLEVRKSRRSGVVDQVPPKKSGWVTWSQSVAQPPDECPVRKRARASGISPKRRSRWGITSFTSASVPRAVVGGVGEHRVPGGEGRVEDRAPRRARRPRASWRSARGRG